MAAGAELDASKPTRRDDADPVGIVDLYSVAQDGVLRATPDGDATPEEFESTDFSREAVVLPNRSVIIYVGPLRAGTYAFFGDFHRNTAQGRLLAE